MNVHVYRDVNRFWSSRRKFKSSRQIDAEPSAVSSKAHYGRGSGINGAKSCILVLLQWNFELKLQNHFHHHTELNYIYSLLTVLFFKLNCIGLFALKKPSSEPCLHLFLLDATIACLIRVLLYRRSVYNFVKHHSELIEIFLKKIRKKPIICNPDNSVPLRLRFHLRWAENVTFSL
jgi:hypothetical protein